jgi:ABC-type polar amino acid transport system ATPase subunit
MGEDRALMIDVIDLHKYFKDHHVLKGLNQKVYKGEVVAIIGPSGGGKSTFIRCLNRLEEPSSGTILIEGTDITATRTDINKVRTEIGMVFQSFNLFPHLTVLQNIKLAPTHVRRMSDKDAEARGRQLLQKVGLPEKANAYPDQLSGGQQQRVAIARALAMQPNMVFFDEPTSALDPEMIREVLDVMDNLAKEGMTMLVISHEIGFIREAATRILVLADGCIIEEGTPENILKHPQHPRTQDFLSKIL